MKRLLTLTAAVLSATVLTQPAFAQPALRLGTPEYGGTGCPQGSASAILSSDRTRLSILYDRYTAETGGGSSLARASCSLAIPLEVPQGLSVSILGIDYRGFNFLPAGGRSTFTVEYFFAGERGPVFERTFMGPLSSNFFIHNDIVMANLVWSACGQDVILRTNSSIFVQVPNGNQQSLVAVDTQDIDAAIVFLLRWRSCP